MRLVLLGVVMAAHDGVHKCHGRNSNHILQPNEWTSVTGMPTIRKNADTGIVPVVGGLDAPGLDGGVLYALGACPAPSPVD